MKFLFCTLKEPGYIYPAIKIAKELQTRGHEVAILSDEQVGPIINDLNIHSPVDLVGNGPAFTASGWCANHAVVSQISHIHRALHQFNPDVLVGGALALGAPIASQWFGVPLVTIGLGTWESTYQPHSLTGPTASIVRWAHQFFGLPYYPDQYTNPQGKDVLLGDMVLLRSVPDLEAIYSLPENVYFIGDCQWDFPVSPTLIDELNGFINNNWPVIYVLHNNRFSSPFKDNGNWRPGFPDYWTHLMTAVVDQPIQLIVATNDDHIVQGLQPPNVFVRKFVPYQAVLPRANVVIAAGTTSIMHGSLTHGLPLLLLPVHSEAKYIRDVCVNAGVAIALDIYKVTSELLRENIQLMLQDHTLHKNAKRIQRAFKSTEGDKLAADLLEQFADEHVSGRHHEPLIAPAI